MVQYMALFEVRCEEPCILLIVEATRMPLSGAQGGHTPLQSHREKIHFGLTWLCKSKTQAYIFL